MRTLKRMSIFLFYMIFPNFIATLWERGRVILLGTDPMSPRPLLIVILFPALPLAVFMIGTILPEVHFLMRRNKTSAYLLSAGLAVNILLNALPLLLQISVPLFWSYTYLMCLPFYAPLLALFLTTLALSRMKGRQL